MIVVSDTSVLIALCAIGKLDILRELYREVVVPTAVVAEITAGGLARRGTQEFLSATWISRREVDPRAVAEFRPPLGEGEAAAIALARSLPADAILIDERLGRQVAEDQGLRLVGVLGILLAAKGSGLIDTLAPLLDSLEANLGFRIGTKLRDHFLGAAGEAPRT